MKINIKTLIICIMLPLIIGGIVGFITKNSMDMYTNAIKPALSPPGIVFPIVWTILYILMGISSYLIYINNSKYKDEALRIYIIQLIVNFIWPIVFFTFDLKFIALIIIVILVYLVYKMIKEFYKINKTAAYLQIPYILWLLFATYLNFSIYLLNR